ncbi:hypothetical protein TI39_contig5843g00009 [Zymoseptoria brevis]|uniref:Acid phosphatase-like protein n=1 Tax=Zymoseptoria brevis TaxID=1047168 RepID=A0A0F4G563_9PEZI|nr:hypothetical protein TI39_contig5843g00009 [Zymoseptoria brevis]
MNAGGVIAIIVIFSLLLGFGGFTIYTRLRANRLGLPPPPLWNPFANRSSSSPDYAAPSPAPHNPLTWLTSKIASFRNQRTAGGAYESTASYPSGGARGASGGGGRRGFGPLDPDEAWDSRVENEIGGGYYEGEDVELGHSGAAGPYGGSGYGGSAGYAEPLGVGVGGRGRSRDRQREVDERYEVETGRAKNPFGDDAATESLRGVSPRPHTGQDTEYRGGGQKGKVSAMQHKKGAESVDDSPTERRSMFTEDV